MLMTIVIGIWVLMTVGFIILYLKTRDDWGEK